MKKIWLFLCLVAFFPLAAELKVLAFAGSVRQDSYNKKLVQDAAEIARQMGATVTVIDLKDYPMPFYDADLEKNEGMPKNAKLFHHLIVANDAIIISTPEYNHSIPGVLKNALDWASRTEAGTRSKDAFKGKKFAIMSTSPSKSGGAKGLNHLRDFIEDLGGTVVKPEVSIPFADKYFSVKDRPQNPLLKEEIQQLFTTTAQ